MLVHQVQDCDRRFQPWGISVVDEMKRLPLQVRVRQVLVQKEEGLQEQLPWLVVEEMEASHRLDVVAY